MANCPKCGAHLRMIDWKQRCPHCKANVFLYDLQERLMLDADKAEVQHYHFQKKVDRLKASFIGSKLAITRIVTSVLPIAAAFLPLFRADLSAVSADLPSKFDALKLYDLVDKDDTGALLDYILSSGVGGKIFLAAIVCLALGLVALLLHLILLFLSCSPKGKIRNLTLSALMVVFPCVSAVLMIFANYKGFAGTVSTVGTYLFITLASANLLVEQLTFWQGIEITHKQCYVGGIPIEEYFELQKTMTPEDLRQEQYRRMQKKREEKEAQLAREQAEKEAAAQSADVESEEKEGAVHGG